MPSLRQINIVFKGKNLKNLKLHISYVYNNNTWGLSYEEKYKKLMNIKYMGIKLKTCGAGQNQVIKFMRNKEINDY